MAELIWTFILVRHLNHQVTQLQEERDKLVADAMKEHNIESNVFTRKYLEWEATLPKGER